MKEFNFNDPESYILNDIELRGMNYKYVDIGNDDQHYKGVVLLLHGFPDSWFGWHKILPYFDRNNYRCIVPSLPGFGGTDSPEINRMTRREISLDFDELLNKLQIRNVIIVGHDWGSFIANRFTLFQPQRVSKVVLLSVPFVPPTREVLSLYELVKHEPIYTYMTRWNEKSNQQHIENHLREFLSNMYSYPNEIPKEFNLNEYGTLEWANNIAPHFRKNSNALLGEHFDWLINQFKTFGIKNGLKLYNSDLWLLNQQCEIDLPSMIQQPLFQMFFAGDLIVTNALRNKASENSNQNNKWQFVQDGLTHFYALEKPELVANSIIEWIESFNSCKI